MFLILISFAAGVATMLSPCILPILPVLLSGIVGGKSRPYGILLGFIVAFSIFTVFITTLVQLISLDLDLLRQVAALVLILMGILLIFPKLQEKINKLIPAFRSADKQLKGGFLSGFLTGLPLGLVWTPCAGPILAAVISLAAVSQAGPNAFLIILAYSLGVAFVSLLIILGSRKLIAKIKSIHKYLGIIHAIFGLLIILIGIALATGIDRKIQTYIIEKTPSGWTAFLQKFENNQQVKKQLDQLTGRPTNTQTSTQPAQEYPAAPELTGISNWINSAPLTLAELKGKVVLIDFWTYSCINCIRTLPYLKTWHQKYKNDGLVIIGVHSPEFEFEKKFENVQKAVTDFGLEYPVALDNEFKTWRAYQNRYWPAKYLIDRDGRIRYTHFGEGEYESTESKIIELLKETGAQLTELPDKKQIEADYNILQTPETYLGYERAESFANLKQFKPDYPVEYIFAEPLASNFWTLSGRFQINSEELTSLSDGSKLRLKFNAREVFLVMQSDQPVTVTVLLNGQKTDLQNKGADVDDQSLISVQPARLYKIIQADQFLPDADLELTLPSGVSAFAFTFGS